MVVDTAIVAAEKAAELASAIKAAGIKAGGRVGIYAPNVPNWMLVIQACNRSSLQVGKPTADLTSCWFDSKRPVCAHTIDTTHGMTGYNAHLRTHPCRFLLRASAEAHN